MTRVVDKQGTYFSIIFSNNVISAFLWISQSIDSSVVTSNLTDFVCSEEKDELLTKCCKT